MQIKLIAEKLLLDSYANFTDSETMAHQAIEQAILLMEQVRCIKSTAASKEKCLITEIDGYAEIKAFAL